jgi:hypothetical protein
LLRSVSGSNIGSILGSCSGSECSFSDSVQNYSSKVRPRFMFNFRFTSKFRHTIVSGSGSFGFCVQDRIWDHLQFHFQDQIHNQVQFQYQIYVSGQGQGQVQNQGNAKDKSDV